MNARMVGLCVGALLIAACRARQVEVRTAPTQQQAAQASLEMNNTLSHAVNVYVALGETDTFLRQLPAKSKETIAVQGFAPGSSATCKAWTLDGVRKYERKTVLTGTVTFPLP